MTTGISGVETRIDQARHRHQLLHRNTRQDVAGWRAQATRLTATVNALNEANEALDAKVNAALALSMLAAAVSIVTSLRRR
ncbi:hypothetical protein [uncultured Rothia sp.]|uniref:hypothetical protein n=1 Tax=uncultured Rothia sp. TaxID=316088 RepID=UPI0025E95C9E|nr:hypothetical protein [uncultured Rothia sp.]